MSSNVWNHQTCTDCWKTRNPGRTVFRAVDDFQPVVRCCFCNADTQDGIVVREKPEKVACKGTEGQHAIDAKKTVAKC